MKKVTLKIDGMSCEHCAKRVKEALEKIKNVSNVQVNLRESSAVVYYSDCLDIHKVSSFIEEEGYQFLGIE